jgi:hypothetical protein
MHWVAGGVIPEVERIEETEGVDPRLEQIVPG